MFFNFAKNKYWTYLFLFIGFYVFIHADQFSKDWIISGVICVFLIFRWRSHALECSIDEFDKWLLKEIIRIHDIPRKRKVRPVMKKKEKSRSGLEPLLEALQAPVLPLNDLDKSNNPNQLNIDIILDNKLFFEELKRKRKKRRIEKYPYLGDKEQLGKEFRYLASLFFKYVFLSIRTLVLWVCWAILALSVCEFLTFGTSTLFFYSEICCVLQEKLSNLLSLYFPPNLEIYVYRLLLAWSIMQPLNRIYLFIRNKIFLSANGKTVYIRNKFIRPW